MAVGKMSGLVKHMSTAPARPYVTGGKDALHSCNGSHEPPLTRVRAPVLMEALLDLIQLSQCLSLKGFQQRLLRDDTTQIGATGIEG